MPRNSILSARTMESDLRNAVSLSKSRRKAEVERLAGCYAARLAAVTPRITVEKFEAAGLFSAEKFFQTAKEGIVEGNAAKRKAAAQSLAEIYRILLDVEKPLFPPLYRTATGGRSGNVLFSNRAATKNNRLLVLANSGFLNHAAIPVPKDFIPIPSEEPSNPKIECPPEPCRPKRFMVSVFKPEEAENLQGAGMSPAFLEFLRKSNQLELRSFEEWRRAKGKPDNEESRREYEKALAEAEDLFRSEQYEDKYGKAGDLPMPGIQRGHRILELSIPISENDFRETGCPERIYQGPGGYVIPPDIDYDILLRRYVQGLRTTERYLYNLPEYDERAIQNYLDEQAGVYDQNTRSRFAGAFAVALKHGDFISLVSQNSQEGIPVGYGPAPESMRDWLLSGDAEDLRKAVLTEWGAAPGNQDLGAEPGRLQTPIEFFNEVASVCVAPPGAIYASTSAEGWTASDEQLGDYKIAGFYVQLAHGEAMPTDADGLRAAVQAKLDRLAMIYDQVWNQARRKMGDVKFLEEIEAVLSPYEIHAHLIWLGEGALRSNATKGLWGVYIPDRNVIVEAANQLAELFKGFTLDPPKESRESLLRTIYSSYERILNLVRSFMGVGTLTGAGAAAASVSATTAEKLYEAWAGVFADFLASKVQGQDQIADNFLVLRVTPCSGRYGEIPQRAPDNRMWPRGERPLSPTHPARLTEAFALEPVPDHFLCYPKPKILLREDYSFSVAHRGFGIGANLYSLSLLPEEEQTIVMKSVKDTTTMISESSAENVLEEATEETASDFASELSTESQRESAQQSQASVSAKASASWGWGSAEVSAGYSAQSSSRSMAKNVSNVSDKLSNKLSAKRKVGIDTKRTVEKGIELHEEVTTERKIRNANKGHTVTFNWFQMTRKLSTELKLEEMQMVYTSGKHNPVRVYVRDQMPLFENEQINSTLNAIGSLMPPDVARVMPPGSAIAIVIEPYTEILPMAGANSFLARVFNPVKAAEIGSTLWQITGLGPAAPEGLGVAAFSGERRNPANWNDFTPLFSRDPEQSHGPSKNNVAADRVVVVDPAGKRQTLLLPNLDLRYRRGDGLPPVRYMADRFDFRALPRLLFSKDQVVNTNGVYCEAMLGRITALEPYLQRHRELDLLEKQIQVGTKELELRWAAAKDGMKLLEAQDGAIVALVEEEVQGQGFALRKALEEEKLKEQTSIAEDELEKKRKESEIDLLEQQVAELKKRIDQIGRPKAYTFDVPKDTKLSINAHLGSQLSEEPPSVSVKVNEGDNDGG